MKLLAIAALAAALLTAQPPSGQELVRTFRFVNAPSPAGLQEAATVLRTVGGIRSLTLDPVSASLSVRATPSEVIVAEWLIGQLDQQASLAPAAVREFGLPGNKDDVIRVAFLTGSMGARDIQELITTMRTVVGVKKISQYASAQAIAYRATTLEVRLSAWLIGQLDQPKHAENQGIHQYTANGDDVTRVFYPANSQGIQDLDRILTAVRASLQMTKAFACTPPSALVFRGTAAQIEKAARLVDTMDRPPVQ